MGKSHQELIHKRQHEVSRLYLEHSTPVGEIAKVMQVSTDTILDDLVIIKEGIMANSSKKSLTELMSMSLEKLGIQENRLLAQAKEDSRYEKLWMDNIQLQQNFLKDILEHAPADLETAISSLTFDEFNKLIGLPIHPRRTSEKLPLTPSQLEIFDTIHHRTPTWLCVNKSRQIGISECVLRIMLYHCFCKYKGGLLAIIAGTNNDTSLALFDRFADLLKQIPKYVKNSKVGEIELINGTKIISAPANPDALRGLTKLKAVLLDEAAFWAMRDDIAVLNTILPLAKTNGSDIYLISTPNGSNNMHYGIMESNNKKWKKIIITIDEGAIGLYTEQEKKEILEASEENIEQEFYCKALTDKDSFFGSLTDDDFTKLEEGNYE